MEKNSGILKINEGSSISEDGLQKNGWIQVGYFASCQIWGNQEKRLLYDYRLKKVYFCYSIRKPGNL